MPTAKTIRTKAKKTDEPVVEEHEETEEKEQDDSHGDAPAKTKKIVEIDDHEPIVGGDDKLEDDPLAAPTEEDELTGEELSLDGEEVNPFGDRWEE